MTELEELQLKHREQAAEKRAAAKERKSRTHRLITRGGILEAALREFMDPTELTDEEVEKVVYFAIVDPRIINYINDIEDTR